MLLLRRMLRRQHLLALRDLVRFQDGTLLERDIFHLPLRGTKYPLEYAHARKESENKQAREVSSSRAPSTVRNARLWRAAPFVAWSPVPTVDGCRNCCWFNWSIESVVGNNAFAMNFVNVTEIVKSSVVGKKCRIRYRSLPCNEN